ncbi:hypothetical protein [Streptomyces sp. NPDC093097]|uniref:hypothetical protein n=1 Tax=Streptomyces sp. NPDC093097 TaxID=3366027 RepID=UPI00382187D9
MTTTAPPAAQSAPASALQMTLRTVTIAACLPYLALKVAWVAGSRVGIPDGSELLAHETVMRIANALTCLMDASVIVLALLLTRPWGRRVPAWLVAVPLWVATGLLAPIVVGFPATLVAGALGAETVGAQAAAQASWLEDWVWSMVYGGFIVQALGLGTLFVMYVRDRWAPVWQGRLGALPPSPTAAAQRVIAVAAAGLALLPAALHALWAAGSTCGLSAGLAAGRTTDFHVVEAVHALWAASAAVGALMLALRIGRGVRVWVPLALAWVGSGATAAWGAWLAVTSLAASLNDPQAPTSVMHLTYAVQMIAGTLIAAAGAYHCAERTTPRTPR